MNPLHTYYIQKPEDKEKENFSFEKKVKIKISPTCQNYIFAPYTLRAPTVYIMWKKKLHTHVDLEEAPQF